MEEQKVVPSVPKQKKKPKQDFTTSFVQASTDQPVGLDVNDFLPKKTFQPIDNAEEILDEIYKNHHSVLSVIKRRTENVTLIIGYWSSGNINATISALNMMNEISVTADVLRYSLVESKVEGLNLEHCAQLLNLAKLLIDSKYESYIRTGINVTNLLLKQFRDIITSTLSAQVMGGVDLSREERVKKCDNCFNGFNGIFESSGLNRNVSRENQTGSLAKELHKNLENFMWETKR